MFWGFVQCFGKNKFSPIQKNRISDLKGFMCTSGGQDSFFTYMEKLESQFQLFLYNFHARDQSPPVRKMWHLRFQRVFVHFRAPGSMFHLYENDYQFAKCSCAAPGPGIQCSPIRKNVESRHPNGFCAPSGARIHTFHLNRRQQIVRFQTNNNTPFVFSEIFV